MTLTRYYPWTHHGRFHDEFKHVLGRVFGDADSEQPSAEARQWTPRVDIREEDKRFVIQADIPGVDPKDIEISMDKNVLTIKGERKAESVEENAKAKRVERLHGTFQRSFTLPDSADADAISASGKHGVLEIAIPKKAETTPRRIEIKH